MSAGNIFIRDADIRIADLEQQVQALQAPVIQAAFRSLGRTEDANGTDWVRVPAWAVDELVRLSEPPTEQDG